jgi:hypothetical protein
MFFELLQITVSNMQVMFNKLYVYDIKENGNVIKEQNLQLELIIISKV